MKRNTIKKAIIAGVIISCASMTAGCRSLNECKPEITLRSPEKTESTSEQIFTGEIGYLTITPRILHVLETEEPTTKSETEESESTEIPPETEESAYNSVEETHEELGLTNFVIGEPSFDEKIWEEYITNLNFEIETDDPYYPMTKHYKDCSTENTFTWISGGMEYTINITITADEYNYAFDHYALDERYLPYYNIADYAAFARDEYDDEKIAEIVDDFREIAYQNDLSDSELLQLIIDFVQQLEYQTDYEFSDGECDALSKYPLQVIADSIGDCEDMSVLMAELIRQLDYKCCIYLFPTHAMVGISPSYECQFQGIYSTFNDEQYFYLETTNPGWKIGQIADEFFWEDPEIFPL